jgi:uncharacterized membrane protein YcaP (DUF421 family)
MIISKKATLRRRKKDRRNTLMMTVLFRTPLIFGALICAMRLMGKRQLGELAVSELVTALLISEIATMPIENPDLPILYAVVPIVTLLFSEIVSSSLLLRIPFLKKVFSSKPCILIRYGIPDRGALRRVRISLDELLSALRQKDAFDISEIAYAILEPNGQISVLKKAKFQPPKASDMHTTISETGMPHPLVIDGKEDSSFAPLNRSLIRRLTQEKNCRTRDIFLMTVDDGGKTRTLCKRDCHIGQKADAP